ncbi:MAG: AraC-like DNA-binding protein [Oleiphilaceae bacterium]|jgi:AraC-like DNA-binding protein
MSLTNYATDISFAQKSKCISQVYIPIARIKPLIKILVMNKVNLNALLANTDISLQDFTATDKTIAFEQYQQLIINARNLSADSIFALRLGEQSFLHHDGLLAARIMSSENVGQAMELLTRYQPLFTQILLFDFELNDSGDGVLTLTPHFELGESLPYFIEYTCSVIYSLGRFFLGGIDLGHHGINATIRLSYPEPSSRDEFDAFFSLPVNFNQITNQLILSKKLLAQPLIFSNKDSAQYNDQICQAKVTEISPDNTILDRVRFLIHRQIFSELSLDLLANELCISPRTLRRQLQESNTSYKMLLESERKRVALSQIKKTEVTIEELAEKLGYSDASSFSRAFKRWYGVSPKHYK